MGEHYYFNQSFWLTLRTRTRVNGRVGSLECVDWCQDAQKEVTTFTRGTVVIGDIQVDQYATSVLSHYWLEGTRGDQTFIADGTAGQFDPQYPEGYYGFLENAPPKLRSIYQKRQD